MRAYNDGNVTGVQGSLTGSSVSGTGNSVSGTGNSVSGTGNSVSGTGNSVSGTGNQAEASVRNGIVAIQECRADLQAFLQRTRTRLSTIANTAVECCEDLVDDSDASRILRGADSSQSLKPLPILAPVVQRRGRALAAETDSMPKKECGGANLPADSLSEQFVPFVSSPLSSKRVGSFERAVLPGRTIPDSKYPMLVASGPDWKVANAFDRNSYYGPTDFGHMPDEQQCSIPAEWCSNVANDRIDAFCNGIPPIEFGTRQVQSGRAHKSSKLHLANQIRQN
jgi:hypothetical protein